MPFLLCLAGDYAINCHLTKITISTFAFHSSISLPNSSSNATNVQSNATVHRRCFGVSTPTVSTPKAFEAAFTSENKQAIYENKQAMSTREHFAGPPIFSASSVSAGCSSSSNSLLNKMHKMDPVDVKLPATISSNSSLKANAFVVPIKRFPVKRGFGRPSMNTKHTCVRPIGAFGSSLVGASNSVSNGVLGSTPISQWSISASVTVSALSQAKRLKVDAGSNKGR